MFLAWITASIKRAVLKGFEEAVEELQLTADPNAPADPLAATRERMQPTLPPPSTNGNGQAARKSK